MLVVSWFICGFLYFFLYSYLFCKLLNISFKANEKIIICSVIISLVYIVYNKYMINDFLWLRPIIVNACSLVLLQFLYKNIKLIYMYIFIKYGLIYNNPFLLII